MDPAFFGSGPLGVALSAGVNAGGCPGADTRFRQFAAACNALLEVAVGAQAETDGGEAAQGRYRVAFYGKPDDPQVGGDENQGGTG